MRRNFRTNPAAVGGIYISFGAIALLGLIQAFNRNSSKGLEIAIASCLIVLALHNFGFYINFVTRFKEPLYGWVWSIICSVVFWVLPIIALCLPSPYFCLISINFLLVLIKSYQLFYFVKKEGIGTTGEGWTSRYLGRILILYSFVFVITLVGGITLDFSRKDIPLIKISNPVEEYRDLNNIISELITDEKTRTSVSKAFERLYLKYQQTKSTNQMVTIYALFLTLYSVVYGTYRAIAGILGIHNIYQEIEDYYGTQQN